MTPPAALGLSLWVRRRSGYSRHSRDQRERHCGKIHVAVGLEYAGWDNAAILFVCRTAAWMCRRSHCVSDWVSDEGGIVGNGAFAVLREVFDVRHAPRTPDQQTGCGGTDPAHRPYPAFHRLRSFPPFAEAAVLLG